MKLSLVLILFSGLISAVLTQTDVCSPIADQDRVDCGFPGIDSTTCVNTNQCCWVPLNPNPNNYPWCYFGTGPNLPCDIRNFNWGASSAGFDQTFIDNLYGRYTQQLDWQGCGDVVASPDTNTPGGSYTYHWMRDGALSYFAFMEINDFDYATISPKMDKYVTWVQDVQNEFDSQVDVRVEPKFYIDCPNGGRPYDQGWCRPQTDGPGLRAMTLSEYGLVLIRQGLTSQAQNVYTLVVNDLDWVEFNWPQSGCDLWEEFSSDDFYWNRAAFVRSLRKAAEFSTALGQFDGPVWDSIADDIMPSVLAHYNGQYIYEANGREKDSSVLHAIATFGDLGPYDPSSTEAAQTLQEFFLTFCDEYPIVKQDIGNGMPGALLGRYPGDTYAGGNPWQLLTAIGAEVLYKGATIFLKDIMTKGVNPVLTKETHGAWLELLQLEEGVRLSDLAARQLTAGDSVMTMLFEKVKNDGGRIDEQIDKLSGLQASAQSLTWSYANILSAWHWRQFAFKKQAETVEFLTAKVK